MAKEKIGRRKAMNRMMKMVAVAAGLSTHELNALLSSQIRDEKTVVLQKSTSKFVKNLKVLIEDSKNIFENEFGRVSPTRQVRLQQLLPDIQRFLPVDNLQQNRFLEGIADPAFFCGRNFGLSDAFKSGVIEGFICAGENSCSGQDVDGGSGCAGTNECNGQTCDGFVCAGNDCEGQSCSDFGYCEGNKQSIVSIADLDKFRTDPYIQLLFQKYNVRTTTQLAAQIRQLFAAQRQTFIRQK